MPFRKEYEFTPEGEEILIFSPEMITPYPLPPNYLDNREHSIEALRRLEFQYAFQFHAACVPTNDSLTSNWNFVALVDLGSFATTDTYFDPLDERVQRIGAVIRQTRRLDESGFNGYIWNGEAENEEEEMENGYEQTDEELGCWADGNLFEEEQIMLSGYFGPQSNIARSMDNRGQLFETRRNERRRLRP